MTRSIPVETGPENDVLMIYQPTARFPADVNLVRFIRNLSARMVRESVNSPDMSALA